VMLASQASTAIVGIFIGVLAREMFPVYWREFIWIGALIQAFVLFPMLAWRLPESPRWLEARGRHADAERVMTGLEDRIASASGAALPAPDPKPRHIGLSEPGAWREILSNPTYRNRSLLILVCWMLAYPGIVYGVGVFAFTYMVDHGHSAEFAFSLLIVGSIVTFAAFMYNARLGERVERRDSLLLIGILFAAAWLGVWLYPTTLTISVGFIIGRVGTSLFLFNLYNYTAVAFPTRIRSVAFAWTDGLGHLGAWAGVTLLGPLYTIGPDHLGWIAFVALPGALLPAVLIRVFGMQQSRAVLEHVSK